MNCKLIFRMGIGSLIAMIATIGNAQTALMPAQTGTLNSTTRGYTFTAPVSFQITGIKVLRQTGNTAASVQNFSILKFDGNVPPPTFSATTNSFTQLALGLGQAADVFVPVNVLVNAGEVIGIYGNLANSDTATAGRSSYGNGSLGTTVMGNSITLARSGMQAHLGTATTPAGMANVWAEPASSNITRIEFTYAPVPEPGTMAAVGLGIAALLRRRRR